MTKIPSVADGLLQGSAAGGAAGLAVGSPAWFAWLADDSLAFPAGAVLAVTVGTMITYRVTSLLEQAAGPSRQATVKTVIDWLVFAPASLCRAACGAQRRQRALP